MAGGTGSVDFENLENDMDNMTEDLRETQQKMRKSGRITSFLTLFISALGCLTYLVFAMAAFKLINLPIPYSRLHGFLFLVFSLVFAGLGYHSHSSFKRFQKKSEPPQKT